MGNGHKAYDSDGFLREKTAIVDAALIEGCERGSPTALKTYYQVTKRTGDNNKPMEFKLDADFIAACYFQAELELGDELNEKVIQEDLSEVPPELENDNH